MPMASTTDTWLDSHQDAYRAATRHPFLLSVRNGTVADLAFNRWLGQDYLFVREFARFVASVLLKAPREGPDLMLILGGLAALDDELNWFQKKCVERGVEIAKLELAPANLEYIRSLQSWSAPDVCYPVAATALWAIELVYNIGWGICLEEDANTPETLRDCCERWGSLDFREYVSELKGLADRILKGANESERKEAEAAFVEILELESAFWDMSRT
eukprot:TRINITY_DN18805_c0_g1_i1.p1 TRINITY_DN18805_c0_g1~~TRINITY_DN18805_c0_g1_i1.p1  ORF type:complete len:217 (-),score=29.34 TRINITY_DN18805_c0_g1_i1:215-865(-)